MSATARVSVSATEFFNPLWFPGGDVASTRPVPKIFLSTVRIPLSTFSGVDLTNLQSVSFSFDQGSSGALLVSDVQFAD